MARTVTVHQPTTGIGPNGRPVTVVPGSYPVADVKGVSDQVLYLTDPDGQLLAAVDGSNPNITTHTSGSPR